MKQAKKRKPTNDFEKFATLVVDELHETEARIEKRFDGIEKRLGNVEGRLVTIETDVRWIRNELMHISKRIDRIEERVEGLAGFAKEIDELRDRVRILEQRAGIAR